MPEFVAFVYFVTLLPLLIIHITFAIGVYQHATGPFGNGSELVPAWVWALTTLLGGVFAAGVYWFVNAASIGRPQEAFSPGESYFPDETQDPLHEVRARGRAKIAARERAAELARSRRRRYRRTPRRPGPSSKKDSGGTPSSPEAEE